MTTKAISSWLIFALSLLMPLITGLPADIAYAQTPPPPSGGSCGADLSWYSYTSPGAQVSGSPRLDGVTIAVTGVQTFSGLSRDGGTIQVTGLQPFVTYDYTVTYIGCSAGFVGSYGACAEGGADHPIGGYSGTLECTVNVAPPPPPPAQSTADLTADSMWWTPTNPVEGQQVTIGFRIKNIGTGSAGPFKVYFSRNDSINFVSCGADISALAAGGTIDSTSPLISGTSGTVIVDGASVPRCTSEHFRIASAYAGGTTLLLQADRSDQIKEANESNNFLSQYIRVSGPTSSSPPPPSSGGDTSGGTFSGTTPPPAQTITESPGGLGDTGSGGTVGGTSGGTTGDTSVDTGIVGEAVGTADVPSDADDAPVGNEGIGSGAVVGDTVGVADVAPAPTGPTVTSYDDGSFDVEGLSVSNTSLGLNGPAIAGMVGFAASNSLVGLASFALGLSVTAPASTASLGLNGLVGLATLGLGPIGLAIGIAVAIADGLFGGSLAIAIDGLTGGLVSAVGRGLVSLALAVRGFISNLCSCIDAEPDATPTSPIGQPVGVADVAPDPDPDTAIGVADVAPDASPTTGEAVGVGDVAGPTGEAVGVGDVASEVEVEVETEAAAEAEDEDAGAEGAEGGEGGGGGGK